MHEIQLPVGLQNLLQHKKKLILPPACAGCSCARPGAATSASSIALRLVCTTSSAPLVQLVCGCCLALQTAGTPKHPKLSDVEIGTCKW